LRDIKWVLLGGDYTNRLYVTITLNVLLAAGRGSYLAFTRRFLAALSAIVLVFAWLDLTQFLIARVIGNPGAKT
jgi:hypothetical protein